MLAFGTFGAPVKTHVARSLDIDPLVMQTYKTGMCFLTSWLFVLVRGEEVTFTPWGIVSGLFWVPGGIATIYAIKTAGLAIGIGVGSSFIVLVSFYWGIFVFGEHVHSRIQACVAMACMLCGLAGMAYYSAPTVAHATTTTATVTDVRGEENGRPAIASSNPGPRRGQYRSVRPDDPDFLPPDVDEDAYVSFRELAAANLNGSSTKYVAMDDNEIGGGGDNHDNVNDGTDDEERDLVVVNRREVDETTTNGVASDFSGASHVLCCFGRLSFQRRTLGILSALFSGIYGGSIMAPLKYAPTDCKGLGYLVSFAIGASIVTLTLWIVRFLHLCCRNGGSVQDAYLALPSMHLKKFWLYGGACGLIWSVGNFFSILSVEFLGEGVGYSVTQASMLVSGLWGIYYFHEIEGAATISKWLLSASVTVVGILLLSFEHHEK